MEASMDSIWLGDCVLESILAGHGGKTVQVSANPS